VAGRGARGRGTGYTSGTASCHARHATGLASLVRGTRVRAGEVDSSFNVAVRGVGTGVGRSKGGFDALIGPTGPTGGSARRVWCAVALGGRGGAMRWAGPPGERPTIVLRSRWVCRTANFAAGWAAKRTCRRTSRMGEIERAINLEGSVGHARNQRPDFPPTNLERLDLQEGDGRAAGPGWTRGERQPERIESVPFFVLSIRTVARQPWATTLSRRMARQSSNGRLATRLGAANQRALRLLITLRAVLDLTPIPTRPDGRQKSPESPMLARRRLPFPSLVRASRGPGLVAPPEPATARCKAA
jgi:hypothetical protein